MISGARNHHRKKIFGPRNRHYDSAYILDPEIFILRQFLAPEIVILGQFLALEIVKNTNLVTNMVFLVKENIDKSSVNIWSIIGLLKKYDSLFDLLLQHLSIHVDAA